MPSVAVTKDSIPHDQFGDISIVMDKNSIDPQTDARNKVYSRDAWTPTFPTVEYKMNQNVQKRIKNLYYDFSKKYGYEETQPLYKYVYELEDILNREKGEENLIENAKKDSDLQKMFLKINGYDNIEPVMMESVSEFSDQEVSDYEYLLNHLSEEALEGPQSSRYSEISNSIKRRRDYVKDHGNELRDVYRNMLIEDGLDSETAKFVADSTKAYELVTMVKNANYYAINGRTKVTTSVDQKATRDAIAQTSKNAGYDQWIENLFKGSEEKKGIRNQLDPYTDSGNLRSFDELHDEYNAENVLNAMLNEAQTGGVGFGSGLNTMMAAQAREFESLDDIIASENILKINNLTKETHDELTSQYNNLRNESHDMYAYPDGNLWDFYEQFANATVESARIENPTPEDVIDRFSQYDFNIDDEYAEKIINLINSTKNLPTDYFEAKPQRVINPSEWKQVYVPNTIDQNLRDQLNALGVDVIEYDPNIKGDRHNKINQNASKYKFSLGLTEEDLKSKDVKKELAPYKSIKENFDKEMISLINEKLVDKEYKNLLTTAVLEQVREGQISNKTLEKLKSETWDRMIDFSPNELYNTYNAVKDYMKEAKISMKSLGFTDERFSENKKGISDFAGKTEWNQFRKSNFGKLNFVKDGGTDIDVIYNELSKQYPNVFDREITAPYDQLMVISEFINNKQNEYNQTHVSEYGFIEYEDVENDINNVINNMVNDVNGYQAHEEAVEKNGSFDVGENPVRKVKIAQETDYGNTNRFARTIAESGSVSDEQVDLLKSKIGQGEFAYEPISNEKLTSDASFKIDKLGIEKSIESYLQEDGYSSRSIAEGELLLNHVAKSGDNETAIKIATKLASQLTEAGRAVQAARLLKRLTPEGQLVHAERTISKLQKSIDARYGKKAPQLEISEELKTSLLNAKDETEMQQVLEDISVSVSQQIPSTLMYKLNSWRYLSMLGNPRTHVRNILGNTMFVPLVSMKNNIGTVLEAAASKKLENRTKTFLNPFSERDKALIDFGKQNFEEYKQIFEKSGKYDLSEMIEQNRDIYSNNNIFGKSLNRLIKANSNALEWEDVFFSKQRYATSLAQYMKANNMTTEDVDSKEFTKAQEYAYKEALKQTYRDENALADAIGRLAKTNKATQLAVDAILPFKKTPMNIVKRGVEYSPIGLIKSITKGSIDLKNGNITANEFIDNLSSGLTGTSVTLLGVLLSSMGIFRTKDDDKERKRAMDQDLGEQEYSLVFPHGSYTIDWAAPMIMPLAIGAELQKGSECFSNIDDLITVASMITDPIFETSMLSGLTSSLQSYSSGTEGAFNMIQNSASSYKSWRKSYSLL